MTKTRDLSDFLIEGGADLPLGVPHIVPDVLYPGYNDKQIDGTTALAASTTGPGGSTVASSKYGTVQSDGRMYYYTDIKGSKPIKDPRIGAHFGSQRHKTKSIQLLEQETATHGNDIFSVDGRDWIRGYISRTDYNDVGNHIVCSASGQFFEITGYFNDVNVIMYTSANRDFTYQLNGATASSAMGSASDTNPLTGRYVDSGSVHNLGLSESTPAINTVRINRNTGTLLVHAIELIAQDTASTANRSKIQIPAQNVVSHGKKFNVSGTPHYDPFTTMSYGGSGTTLSALQSLIDTDTSLGMDAWKAGTSNYHRPWNGGRVIKWVDSSGTIKTSVNMMPPNAQNITTTASNAVSDAHVIAGTNDDIINFNTSAINNEQSELAKSFYTREFGNGSSNGGTGSATFADVSMLNSADNVAYCMDDGLTSISAIDVRYSGYTETLHRNGTSTVFYLTFIGTGIARNASLSSGVRNNFAQNLPYGTHVLSMVMYTNADLCRWYLDGAEILDNADSPYSSNPSFYHNIGEQFHIYQPKRPPIPEDACVLADYMLMADFVGLGANNNTDKRANISKGVRRLSASRDVFYNNSAFTLSTINTDAPSGFSVEGANNDYSALYKIAFFGDTVVHYSHDPVTRFLDSACTFSSGTKGTTVDISSTNNAYTGARQFSITDGPRLTTFTADSTGASNSYTTKNTVNALDLNTPIHTSFHYQSFETPLLHELVGGDRNMEQTNLVCSPDGKTWDEVTRDTSYLASDMVLSATNNTTTTWATVIVLDEWRGKPLHGGTAREKECFNKDSWAIAYDRMICLKEGTYEMFTVGAFDGHQDIYVNGISAQLAANASHSGIKLIRHMKRGDYVQPTGDFGDNSDVRYSHFYIKKIN